MVKHGHQVKLVTIGRPRGIGRKRGESWGPWKKNQFCRNHSVVRRGYRTVPLYLR